MSSNASRDSAGRKQPSLYRRNKRAKTAANHRWKHKQQLIPGIVRPWSERSYANKLRHLAAAKRGGATTGGQIKEQQRLFWDFYHGNCKSRLRGPFTAVVETFERIEAAYDQRYGHNGTKGLAWDGFFARMLYSFVFAPCWKRKPEDLEREMWELYGKFMEADDSVLWGDGERSGLLSTLLAYDDALAAKQRRIDQWRRKNLSVETSKNNKNK